MRRRLAKMLVAVSLAGCAGRPTGDPLTRAAWDSTELIPYRALTRDDFRAPFALGFSVTEEARIGATTCAKIVMRPEDVVTRAEQSSYVATLDDPIFFAVFNRKCSWWNPEKTADDESSILEHEQVHFAIIEVEARRLNGRAHDIAERVRTVGSDARGVYDHAGSELHPILKAASEAAHNRNELFDIQTYEGGRVRQRQWFLKLTGELEATEALARGPQTSIRSAVASASAAHSPAPVATAVPLPPQAQRSEPAPISAPPTSVPAPTAPAPTTAPTAPVTNPEATSTGSFPD